MSKIKFRFFRTKVKEMVYGFEGCSVTYVLGLWDTRIDEMNKSIPEGSIDIDAIRNELNQIDTEIDANKTLINNIQNGQALQSKELENKVTNVNVLNLRHENNVNHFKIVLL